MKEKVKKPLYKKWWFWVIVVLLVGAIGSGLSGGESAEPSVDQSANAETQAEDSGSSEVQPPVPADSEQSEVQVPVSTLPEAQGAESENQGGKNDGSDKSVPREYLNALAKAESYSDLMSMSKQGIYDQLVSEYGDKFPEDAAQYAIDNLEADYNANALAKAKTYYEEMNMSKSDVHDQLVSEYGEKFTVEEADYAIAHLDD